MLLPYLYDDVLILSYTLVWKVCARWVGTSLFLVCLFPMKSDIHKKGLRAQHALVAVISLSFCAPLS